MPDQSPVAEQGAGRAPQACPGMGNEDKVQNALG